MCGIAGLVDFDGRLGPERLRAIAQLMADRLAHRGPDGEGVWVSDDGACAFSHRRLAIVDPSDRGRQPMTGAGAAGTTALTFNGELYNYEALRADLARRGAAFGSRSDTEVMLRGLDAEGEGFLARTDAMYALGYWTGEALLLARDRFGEKPLYYLARGGLVGFASELHALYAIPGFDDRVSTDAIALYCAFHHLPAPYSIYESVRKLPPGGWLTARRTEAGGAALVHGQSRRFLHAPRRPPERRADRADALEAALQEAVRSRMTGDVPLSAFLSAGVDSATVVALMARHCFYPVRTYSIGFEGYPDSEHLPARALSESLGLEHETRLLRPEDVAVGRELARDLDEPNGDSSCLVTALLSEQVSRRRKVVLSGDGGDELFGGYPRYGEARARVAAQADGGSPGRAYFDDFLVFPQAWIDRLFGGVPPLCRAKLEAIYAIADAPGEPLTGRLRRLDADDYLSGAVLSKVDRMSMRYGVEVRAPFLAASVAAFAEGLDEEECLARGGKGLLKTVADRYLPPGWCDRAKRGFGLPMDGWARPFLERECRALLGGADCRLAAWIAPGRLRALIGDAPTPAATPQLWTLFMLESWLRAHPAAPAS